MKASFFSRKPLKLLETESFAEVQFVIDSCRFISQSKYLNNSNNDCDWLILACFIKHLMTGPKGNSEFCFPETLNVPRGEAEGNIEVEGKQNSLFPEGPVIKCFVIPSNSNIGKKTCENMICTSGSRAEMSCRNYTTITVYFFAANTS